MSVQRVPSPGPAPLTQLKLLLRDLAVEGHKLRLLGGETQSGKELSELREELIDYYHDNIAGLLVEFESGLMNDIRWLIAEGLLR